VTTLAETIRTRLLTGFPHLTAEERERLADIFMDVHRVSRAEGMLEILETLRPYISPELRPSAAFVAARASMMVMVETREGFAS